MHHENLDFVKSFCHILFLATVFVLFLPVSYSSLHKFVTKISKHQDRGCLDFAQIEAQLTFTCLKSAIETLEKGVKDV